jgi:preprotein translocase subunit SecA
VGLGGLYVIGTNRHESRRIDDQLRGRAGRQGDPGKSRFFVSLEDDLMVRFGIDRLIPDKFRPAPQDGPVDHPVIRSEVARLQRIVEGQNYEIRKTLRRYSSLVEEQRKRLQDWRVEVLMGEVELDICAARAPERYGLICDRLGEEIARQAERAITLHHIDQCWAEHLAFIAQVREGIHLAGIAGQNPLLEFHKQIAEAFWRLQQTIEDRIVETFNTVEITDAGVDLEKAGLQRPSSTWTYLINDRAMSDLRQLLFGQGNYAFAAGAMVMMWPLLPVWWIWRRWTAKSKTQ